MKTRIILSQVILALVPLAYLSLIWNRLPARVPLRFYAEPAADSYGSKWSFAGILFVMAAISIAISLLLLNIDKVDPRWRGKSLDDAGAAKASWVIVSFMAVLGVWVVYYMGWYVHKWVI